MLTGDNRLTGEAIGKELGVDEVRAELLPEDKINAVKELQKQYGQEYSGEFEFYTKKRNAYLLAGNQLQIAGVDYDIVAVRDYIKAITLLLVKANG